MTVVPARRRKLARDAQRRTTKSFGRGAVRWMIVSETTLLISTGLALGVACALVAVQPALAKQGGGVPVALVGAVTAAVLAAGLLSSLIAAGVALRLPLLASLKAE